MLQLLAHPAAMLTNAAVSVGTFIAEQQAPPSQPLIAQFASFLTGLAAVLAAVGGLYGLYLKRAERRRSPDDDGTVELTRKQYDALRKRATRR